MRRIHSQKAFTFVELLIGLTLFAIIASSIYYSLTAGVGALLLFWRLARSHLDPIATNLAVGIFADGYVWPDHATPLQKKGRVSSII